VAATDRAVHAPITQEAAAFGVLLAGAGALEAGAGEESDFEESDFFVSLEVSVLGSGLALALVSLEDVFAADEVERLSVL
jgi:hypothetical protein